MIRAAIVWTVLTLAVGPSASLLCKATCHPQPSNADACHHQQNPARLNAAGDNDCDNVVLTFAVVKEDVTRALTNPQTSPAIHVAGDQAARAWTNNERGERPPDRRSLQIPPFALALRI